MSTLLAKVHDSAVQNYFLDLQQLQQVPPAFPSWIRNLHTDYQTLEIQGHIIPITKNQTDYHNSYVCSPYTAYISYARDELGLLSNKGLRWFLKGVIQVASGLLKLGKINQTIAINNWLFSTNLIPKWHAETIQNLTQHLSQENPKHSLTIRSLNQETDHDVMQNLQQQGWLLLPARQIYLFTKDDNWWQRNNVKNDQRLLRKTKLTLVAPKDHQTQDFIDIENCFHQLFIEKHSQYNPQFTAVFFELAHRHQQVEFFSFKDKSGRIIASIGLFTQHNIITAPIVGYDTNLPQKLGLYRLLMAILLKITHERNQTLNLSSGASHFKRQRGGKPIIEYTALYVKHLPFTQRIILKTFSRLLNHFGSNILINNHV